MAIEIRLATLNDIELLTPLFDGYAQFYRQPSNPEECRNFLTSRLKNKEAFILLAFDQEKPAGFTLLYPCFSSVSRAPVLILNDLFVDPKFRRHGIGKQLLLEAANLGRKKGAIRLHLETEVINTSAQALYEREGWIKESESYHYYYTL